MRYRAKRITFATFLFLLGASFSLAQPGKSSHDLGSKNPNVPVDVIVQYKFPPGAAQHQKASAHNGQLKKVLGLINGAVYTMPPGQAIAFSNDPDVNYISPDRPLQKTLDYSRQAILADVAQSYGWDGTGIGIAILDSGVAPMADFGRRIVYSQYFNGPSSTDDFGHGTHVAGIAAGNGANSGGQYKGIAPNANIINLRVLDSNGGSTDSIVISAINQAISLKSAYNIRVMNLSLGRSVQESYTQDPLCQAVEQAWKAGIVVVVAAGNQGRDNSQGTSGYGTINVPGNDPYVITVGAMKTGGTPSRTDDLIASYSSKGPTLFDHVVKPDVVAPGNQVVSDGTGKIQSVLAQLYPQNIVNTNYFRLSGTSMATPMVSGAAALLLQKYPNMTPDQVKSRLMKTAYKTFPISSVAIDPTTGISYTSYYDIFTVGAGYVDVNAALNSSYTSYGYALSPTAVYHWWTNSFTLVGTSVAYGVQSIWDSNSLWDSSSIWDTQSVWGTAILVSGTQSLWGTQSVWGSSTNSVWGTNSIWDDSAPVSESVTTGGEK